MTSHHRICLLSGYLSAGLNTEPTDENTRRNCVKTSKICQYLKCIKCWQIVRHDHRSAVVAKTSPNPHIDGSSPPKFSFFVSFLKEQETPECNSTFHQDNCFKKVPKSKIIHLRNIQILRKFWWIKLLIWVPLYLYIL